MPATLPEQEEETPAALGGHIPGPFAAWRHHDYRLLVTGEPLTPEYARTLVVSVLGPEESP